MRNVERLSRHTFTSLYPQDTLRLNKKAPGQPFLSGEDKLRVDWLAIKTHLQVAMPANSSRDVSFPSHYT